MVLRKGQSKNTVQNVGTPSLDDLKDRKIELNSILGIRRTGTPKLKNPKLGTWNLILNPV